MANDIFVSGLARSNILASSKISKTLPAMTEETAQRIQKLESHIAEMERQMEQLNEVVVEQSRSLDKLKSQLRRITDTIENQELQRIKDTNPKPPHYQ